MACRNEAKALQAVDDIKKSLGAESKVSFMKLDLASLQSVRNFASAFAESKFVVHYQYLPLSYHDLNYAIVIGPMRFT